jgi:hypothetical protein
MATIQQSLGMTNRSPSEGLELIKEAITLRRYKPHLNSMES